MFLRYQQVSRIVELVKPATIIEIGTWNGDHALIMAKAALKYRARLHYTGYDLFDTATDQTDQTEFNVRSHHSRAAVQAKLAAFQADNPGFTFDLVEGDTRSTLGDSVADFAYIDGGHSVETIGSDYAHLKRCGAIVFDDYYDFDASGRRPDIDAVGCNRLLADIPHIVLPAFDELSTGGRILMAAAGRTILDLMARDPIPPSPSRSVRRAFVTTFATTAYYDYGKRLIESIDRFLPADVQIHVYLESALPLPDSARIHHVNMMRACPDMIEFKTRHGNVARANGDLPGGHDYRFDAVKFCHKVFALTHAARTVEADVLYWIDADSVMFRDAGHGFLDGLLPDGVYTSYLGRHDTHSECGFMAFDLTHPANADFMDFWQRIYAEDLVFQLPEWHDSFVYDVVRKFYESKGLIVSADLRAGMEGDHQPFINSPLGACIDHLIGPRRKKSGCSYALDVRTPRPEFYWQVVPWTPEDLIGQVARRAGGGRDH